MDRFELYTKTIERLARAGAKDPITQVLYLAEEIERYREKIYGLDALLKAGEHLPGEGVDVIGVSWFPRLTSWGSIANWIAEKRQEGWEPYKWTYEPGTATDYDCLTLTFQKRR